MTDWRDEVENTLAAFVTVAELAGAPISRAEMKIEYLEAPLHPPKQLPCGTMAACGFWCNGEWLKIGKVGPNSSARYANQHYNLGSALSTLAGSLAKDPHMQTIAGFDPLTPGAWIKATTHRVNILLPSNKRYELLSLLEAFFHLRLGPRYEG